jgi:hypothetical protein
MQQVEYMGLTFKVGESVTTSWGRLGTITAINITHHFKDGRPCIVAIVKDENDRNVCAANFTGERKPSLQRQLEAWNRAGGEAGARERSKQRKQQLRGQKKN